MHKDLLLSLYSSILYWSMILSFISYLQPALVTRFDLEYPGVTTANYMASFHLIFFFLSSFFLHRVNTLNQIHTVPLKGLDEVSRSVVFVCFLPCRVMLKTSKLWQNTYGIMLSTNKKVLNEPYYVSQFRFFKVANFWFDESFAHVIALNQLHPLYNFMCGLS